MNPAHARSLERTLSRAQWLAVAVVALATVLVGGAAFALASLRQDDATSLALAGVLVAELENHAGDSAADLDAKIERELLEQASFGREIAVYVGSRAVGRKAPSIIPASDRVPGQCRSESIDGGTWRVCSAMASTGATVHVAAPLARLFITTQTLMLVLIAAAIVTSAGFGLLSRRIVRRSLKPFDELRRGMMAMPANASTELAFVTRWNVVEVDSVAAAFDQLLSRVRDAVERERRFVADASHELRTPLTRLRGQLETLADAPTVSSAADTLAAARRSCELLGRTTESLLALARDEALLSETVDVSEIIAAIREDMASRDDHLDRRVLLDAPEEALVRGDPQLLRLAAANLLDNALKYSDGSVRVIVTSSRGSRSGVALVVEDDGPGIPEGDIARLLRPFSRGASRVRGTGLGLALVDHVVGVHRGTLALGRSSSGGLRATVTLPVWAPTTLGVR